MNEIPLSTTAVLVARSAATPQRCANAHNGWDPAFVVLPVCESLFPPRRSKSSRWIRCANSSPRHQTGRPNFLLRPQFWDMQPQSHATHAPASAPACSQLPRAPPDSHHAPAHPAWLLEPRHPQPNPSALPTPSCAPRDSDPSAPPTTAPYALAHLAPAL